MGAGQAMTFAMRQIYARFDRSTERESQHKRAKLRQRQSVL